MAWPAAVAEALEPALDAAADHVVAEARRGLAASGLDPATAVVTGRDADGRVTVTVADPAAAALEYATRRIAARPFLRPAIAGSRDAIRDHLAAALRRALPARGSR